jgi:hypothetical protein
MDIKYSGNMFSGCSTISSTCSRTNPRGFHHTIQANGDIMPISGLPARGWRRQPRGSASTEHLDRLQGTMRAWESTATARKPTTLPPNMEPPKFFHKSPRDALRRVTSLLMNRKGTEFAASKILSLNLIIESNCKHLLIHIISHYKISD